MTGDTGTIILEATASARFRRRAHRRGEGCDRLYRTRSDSVPRIFERGRDRLTSRADGQVQYQLKHPFRDGTTHMVFSPLDFIGKLVALVPRPRHHPVRYHGVLAPNAKLRKYIVPAKASTRPAAKRKTDHKKLKATTDTPQQDADILG